MSENERIERDPGIQGGQPVVRGTRIPVDVIRELWERGWTVERITAELPALTPDDVAAALDT